MTAQVKKFIADDLVTAGKVTHHIKTNTKKLRIMGTKNAFYNALEPCFICPLVVFQSRYSLFFMFLYRINCLNKEVESYKILVT